MSEPKPDYIADALEMIGITEPKQIVTEISGFIPVFDVVIKHYKDPMTALVFGRMWQYCGMEDGVCKASLDRIGKDLGISGATVMRHAEKLVNDGYLVDTTPNRRNSPHEYLDGRKVEMKSRFSGGFHSATPTVSKRNATVSTSQLIKQDNTILNNNDISSKPAKEKMDTLLEFEKLAQRLKNAQIEFEAQLGFNPAWSKPDWEKQNRKIADLLDKDPNVLKDFSLWRKGEGKYQGLTNASMAKTATFFMDVAYPTFLASVAMSGNSNTPIATQNKEKGFYV